MELEKQQQMEQEMVPEEDVSKKNSYPRFPKVSIMETVSSKYALKFKLWDTDVSMANALRRIMLVEVPTVAIDLVEFETNSSVLLDEVIAHRLGLIPLSSNGAMAMLYSSECPCTTDSCARCSIELQLNVKCTSDRVMVVTSRDLTCSDANVVPLDVDVDMIGGQSEDMAPTREIAITKLLKGQEIILRAIARKGVGSVHAKWSPVGTVTFHHEPEIFINQQKMQALTIPQKQAWVTSSLIISAAGKPGTPGEAHTPTKVFKLDPLTEEVVVVNPGVHTSDELLRNAEASGTSELFEILTRDDSFVFSVESTGALPSAKIFLDAIKVMKQKLLALRLAEDGSPLPLADHELITTFSPERNNNDKSQADNVTNGFANMSVEEEEAPAATGGWDDYDD